MTSRTADNPSPAPRVVLWDVMDTLVRDPFRDVMPGYFGLSLSEMLELKHPDAWPRFERGELSEHEFLRSFFADGRPFDHDGFCRAIRGAYEWLDGMESVLAELARRRVEMHVVSNYPIWYQWIEERLGLSRYVAWSFVSCTMGVRKPAPEIYQRAAAALALSPANCLFIDDREQNCEGARLVGMQAIHYTGDPKQLLAQLKRLGLL